MTDTPVEELTTVEEAPPDEPQGPTPGNCRWCGAYHEQMPDEPEDWLCSECERYQDAMICPTCGNLARVTVLPAEMIPEAAPPKRRKK